MSYTHDRRACQSATRYTDTSVVIAQVVIAQGKDFPIAGRYLALRMVCMHLKLPPCVFVCHASSGQALAGVKYMSNATRFNACGASSKVVTGIAGLCMW